MTTPTTRECKTCKQEKPLVSKVFKSYSRRNTEGIQTLRFSRKCKDCTYKRTHADKIMVDILTRETIELKKTIEMKDLLYSQWLIENQLTITELTRSVTTLTLVIEK